MRQRAGGGVVEPDGGVGAVPEGVIVDPVSVVMRVLSVALPLVVRRVVSEALVVLPVSEPLWVLAQAAVIASVEAAARPKMRVLNMAALSL